MLFAHLPGHPVGYRAPPPEDEHPLTIEREIADSASDPSAAEALARVASRHAWVLVWGKAPSGFSPSNHVEKLRHGRLVILGPP